MPENNLTLVDELVQKDDQGQIFTTSLIIAEKFGKQHKNVLRDIQNLEVPVEFSRLNFEPRDYVDERGKSWIMYRITRDGFMLLVMGFTGREAMVWKLRFIEAFNAMEQRLAANMLTFNQMQEILAETVRVNGITAQGISAGLSRLDNRCDIIEEKVEDIADAVRSIDPRKPFSEAIKHIYRLIVVKYYRRLCPCCQDAEIIKPDGSASLLARYDHWYGRSKNWQNQGWIVCKSCNDMLERKRHLHTKKFDLFQERLTEMTGRSEQLSFRLITRKQ